MTRPDEMIAMVDQPEGNYYAQLEDGRILSVADDGFRTSEDGGLTWSEPSRRRDADGGPVGPGAMSLLSLSGNKVGLVANPRPPGDGHVLFWRSEDGGETWSSPVRATPPGTSTYVVSTDVVMRTSSGRIIVPCYVALGKERDPSDRLPTMWGKLINGQWAPVSGHYSDPRFTAVYVAYSDDEGRTWRRNEDGELLIALDWSAIYTFVNEASVAEVAPGRLLMMLRTGLGRLYQAWSGDDGTTWSRPEPTSLAASTTPAYVASLPHPGHLLVVWNQHSEEEIKRGYTRSRLSAAVSRNGGSVWEFFQNVESWHEETRVEPGPIRPGPPGRVRLRARHAGRGAGAGAHPLTHDGRQLMGLAHHLPEGQRHARQGLRPVRVLPVLGARDQGGVQGGEGPAAEDTAGYVVLRRQGAGGQPEPAVVRVRAVRRVGAVTLTPALSRQRERG